MLSALRFPSTARSPGAIGRRLNPEIVEGPTGPKLLRHPVRLLATSGPRLCGFGGVSVLREHLWIGSPLTVRTPARYIGRLELPQSLLKLGFFRRYFARKNKADFGAQSPKLVDGHRIKSIAVHVFSCVVFFLAHRGKPLIRNSCKTGRIRTPTLLPPLECGFEVQPGTD